MIQAEISHGKTTEELLAELAVATYRVARRHDFKGAFIDIELDLWDAHRAVQTARPSLTPTASSTSPG